MLARIRVGLMDGSHVAPELASLSRDAELRDLAWHVYQAIEGLGPPGVPPTVSASPSVLGGLAARLRRPFHDLVRFYVERASRRTLAADEHLARAILILAARATAAEEQVSVLRSEIAALRRPGGD